MYNVYSGCDFQQGDNIGITSSTCRHYTLINSIMCRTGTVPVAVKLVGVTINITMSLRKCIDIQTENHPMQQELFKAPLMQSFKTFSIGIKTLDEFHKAQSW